MDLLTPRRRTTWRAVAVLTAGIIGGAAVLTPAVGGAAAFLTKKKADKKYLQNSTMVTNTITQPGDSYGTATVNCPLGQQALSGGGDSPFFVGDPMPTSGMLLHESKPILSGTRATGWTIEFRALGTDPIQVTVHAVCAK
jgi:hypothetical protein